MYKILRIDIYNQRSNSCYNSSTMIDTGKSKVATVTKVIAKDANEWLQVQ